VDKQEEIEEWAFAFLRPMFGTDEDCLAYIHDFFRGLAERGVVIKVKGELPSIFDINDDVISALEYKRKLDVYTAVESLI